MPARSRRSAIVAAFPGGSRTLPRTGRLLEVGRTPHVAAAASASFVARLPRGMAALAIVLFVHQQTRSYAIAGGAAAALSIGDAVGSPLQGA